MHMMSKNDNRRLLYIVCMYFHKSKNYNYLSFGAGAAGVNLRTREGNDKHDDGNGEFSAT